MQIYKYLGIFVLLFLNGGLVAQDEDTLLLKEAMKQVHTLYDDEKYTEAIPYAEKAIGLAAQIYGEESNQYAESLDDLAFLYHDLGALKKAETLYKKSLLIATENKEKASSSSKKLQAYSNATNNLALLYRDIGKYEDAELLFMNALAIDKKMLGEEHPYILMGLNNLAIVYQNMNQYIKVEKIYVEILKICETNPAKYYPYIAQVSNNLGVYYSHTRQYEKAIPLAKRSIEIYETYIGKDHDNYALGINNLALLYCKLGKLSLAEEKYLEAIKLQETFLGLNDFRLVHPLKNLSALYVDLNEYAKAEKIHKRLEQLYQINQREDDMSFALIKEVQAELYMKKGALDIAYKYLDEAFYILSNKKHHLEDIGLNKVDVKQFFLKSDFITPVFVRIQHWYLLKNEALGETYKSLKNLYDFVVFKSLVYKFLLKKLSKKKDKLRLISGMGETLYQCIELAEKLYIKTQDTNYLKHTLDFAEYNKSIVLSESLQSTEAFNFGDVPDSLTNKEQLLKQELDKLEKQEINATNIKDLETLDKIRTKQIELNLEQDALLKYLKDNYPKYSKLRYEQQNLVVEEVQEQLLDKQTALLEYFIYDTIAYLIVLKQNSIDLKEISFQKGELAKEIASFRKGLSDYIFITGQPNKAYALYTKKAYYFYQKLIAPANLEGINKLIVVPDNLLAHIPFETFLQAESKNQNGSYTQLDYLINNYTISYSYSTELLLENKKQVKQQNNKRLLAMGAMYSTSDSSVAKNRSPLQKQLRKILAPLPSIKKEIRELANQYGQGTFLYGQEATESEFKKIASNYAIVHLAMHGLLNEHNPLVSSLAFTENGDTLEDNFLEAHEISNLELNSDLVVLSACETGYGKFEQGEGVMSLARSFMYAGVPSLVVSLWQVNDNATAILMQNFYAELYKGIAKNEALRKAKMDYISKVKGIGAHPAFWSPFIQLGNTDKVEIQQSKTWVWWVLGGLGAVLGVFLGLKWMKKSEFQ